MSPDFEAEVTLMPRPDGSPGQKQVGWTPGIAYDDDGGWTVLPIQWSANGKILADDEWLPTVCTGTFRFNARQYMPRLREFLRVGTEFRFIEGYRTSAIGRVTRVYP